MSAPIIRSLPELRQLTRAWRAKGETIGVVPTMGALHQGHLSLVQAAKASCDHVIVTLFVNPRQFNSPEDFARYPRTEEEDAQILGPYGVDALFVPDGETVYPAGHATTVSVTGVSTPLEGAHRIGHFDGVATVVTLLLNMTQADRAFFGEKDWQQLQVVKQLVRDLHLPVEIVACPSLRNPDGLALSSRNQRLSADALELATALPSGLLAAAKAIEGGAPIDETLAAARRRLKACGLGPVDYLELCDSETLGPYQKGRPGRLLAAVWLEDVRLIDNVAVS
ncbi:pantoate--beta-alanine ligase [Paracoccus sp. (in: a-proteobacteria)]|uniref:pantoate--beta-alanine ligase n=1 Tax=Paracoccus sp. TaxID=267 RepID=UPI002897EFC8|nr:pantoate--beta-alanine ligase [Paracoccus sp. (in: a-proteobacteria)]